MIADMLEGNKVLQFVSGEEAIAWLKKNPEVKVDLVISDYNMPGRNGAETCGEIRGLAPQAKFILMSATIVENLDFVAQKNLFDGWLSKPFSPTAFEEMVGRLLPHAVSFFQASAANSTASVTSIYKE